MRFLSAFPGPCASRLSRDQRHRYRGHAPVRTKQTCVPSGCWAAMSALA